MKILSKSVWVVACAMGSVLSGSSAARAQCEVKFFAGDGARGDSFGRSVSISGNTLVVGAYGDDDVVGQSGSVYVSRRDEGNWVEKAKLADSGTTGNAWFGVSVSLSAESIVVGAWAGDGANDSSGAAHVFPDLTFEDLTRDGVVNLNDILCVLDAFSASETPGCPSIQDADIVGMSETCEPNGIIDLGDILAVLKAFQGISALLPIGHK